MKVREIALITAGVLISSLGSAQWNKQVIDQSGDSGRYSKIVLDSSGTPHVVYTADGGRLFYAKWIGWSWERTELKRSPSEHIDPEICLNSDGVMAIATLNRPAETYRAGALEVYVRSIEGWPESPVGAVGFGDNEPRGTWRLSAEFTGDMLHVIISRGDLRHFVFDLSLNTFTLEEVIDPSIRIYYDCSVAVDSNDALHVSYCDDGDLKYAYYDGSSWHTQYVDTVGSVGKYNSIVLRDGKPHIFYYDETNGNLKHAVLE